MAWRPLILTFGFSMACSLACAEGESTLLTVPQESNGIKWGLHVATNVSVPFHGTVSFDNVGASSAQMLYPAPNVAGFIAAVLTHGLIVESSKESQREKLQVDADNILSPYRSILSGFTLKELYQRSLPKMTTRSDIVLLETDETQTARWSIDAKPTFFLTQDCSAIIVNNEIKVYKPDSSSAPAYVGVIKVVSKAKVEKDFATFWTAGNGEQFKQLSAEIFAQSLDIVINDILNSNLAKTGYKTLRYYEGGTEKFERGQIISESCDRVMIRTLRGAILSVPGRC